MDRQATRYATLRTRAAGPERERISGHDFAMAEHSAMLAKLEKSGEDIYRIEILVPGAIGALYVWLVSNAGVAPSWLYLIAPVIALLGLLRYLARLKYVKTAEKYVRKLEERLRGGSYPRGWEHFYSGKLGWYTPIRIAYWVLLLAGTSFIAYAKHWSPGLLG
jgi:hypothetical protein